MSENPSAEFRSIPQNFESSGSFPPLSESFRNVPHHSEAFATIPKPAERKEIHTLTVRDAARMFEAASVARTERSIINWCQPNKTGIARLDAYFDPNERKYYITSQSVELAIAEEKAKAAKINSEPFEPFRNDPSELRDMQKETAPEGFSASENATEKVKTLESEIMDLKILNSGKISLSTNSKMNAITSLPN